MELWINQGSRLKRRALARRVAVCNAIGQRRARGNAQGYVAVRSGTRAGRPAARMRRDAFSRERRPAVPGRCPQLACVKLPRGSASQKPSVGGWAWWWGSG